MTCCFVTKIELLSNMDDLILWARLRDICFGCLGALGTSVPCVRRVEFWSRHCWVWGASQPQAEGFEQRVSLPATVCAIGGNPMLKVLFEEHHTEIDYRPLYKYGNRGLLELFKF